MIYTPEVQSRISDLATKQAAGTLTKEDVAESVRLLRENRMAAAAAKKPKKKAKAPVDTAKLFEELKKL